MFLTLLICARPIFLKMEMTFFFLGFCPPSIRAGGGTNADSVLRKLFFGERISQNIRLLFLEFGSRKRRRRGLGRNPPLAPLFSFGEIRAGKNFNNSKKITQCQINKIIISAQSNEVPDRWKIIFGNRNIQHFCF